MLQWSPGQYILHFVSDMTWWVLRGMNNTIFPCGYWGSLLDSVSEITIDWCKLRPNNCHTDMWKITSNPLDIDFIDIQRLSYRNIVFHYWTKLEHISFNLQNNFWVFTSINLTFFYINKWNMNTSIYHKRQWTKPLLLVCSYGIWLEAQ